MIYIYCALIAESVLVFNLVAIVAVMALSRERLQRKVAQAATRSLMGARR